MIMSNRSNKTPSSVAGGKRRKRQSSSAFSSIETSYQDKDNDFVCAICFDMMDEAYMTQCGHSFCHKCITQSLERTNRCPKCNYGIEKRDQIYPNFHLNEMILKHKQRLVEQKKLKLDLQANQGVQEIMNGHERLDLPNINLLLDVLTKKKQKLEGESEAGHYQIVREFLEQIHEKQKEQLEILNRQMRLVDRDLRIVISRQEEYWKKYPHIVNLDSQKLNGLDASICGSQLDNQSGFNGSQNMSPQWLQTNLASRRKKVSQHMDDLEQYYFSLRQLDVMMDSSNTAGTSKVTSISGMSASKSMSAQEDKFPTPSIANEGALNKADVALDEFCQGLSKFTQYSALRPLATLHYASDLYNTSSIVSSIEFDRDQDFFAIAGVTKKIKVFDYATVIRDAIDIHYPVNEMLCQSKISSLIWSNYHKGMLASSDYEGTVTLWDAFTGQKSRIFQEHEKRCWSVDFNHVDPKLLASGSDDSKVKLWHTNMENSVSCIDTKANVCCVKFNPASRYHLAFGSADHCVHYFDLRNSTKPLMVFKGHRKAVSYTKFVNNNEIISASTDSQLKLWSLDAPPCVRTFQGHQNEKNFVGLATDGDYVACGSENNSLYVYYKGLSKQLLTYKFDPVRTVLDKERKDEDSNEFVSAVCWRPESNVILAANSQGMIKVLELV